MKKLIKMYKFDRISRVFEIRFFLGLTITAMILALIIPFVFAWSEDEFNNTLSSENITFSGDENYTRWLSVPEDTFITNAVMNLSGYEKKYLQTEAGDPFTFSSMNEGRPTSEFVAQNITLANLDLSKLAFIIDCSGTCSGNVFYRIKYPNYTQISECDLGLANDLSGTSFKECDFADDPLVNGTIYLMVYRNDTTSGDILIYHETTDEIEGHAFKNYSNTIFVYSYDFVINITFVESPLYPFTPYLEVGTPDGIFEWNHTGEFNSTNSPQKTSNFAQTINQYISTATAVAGYYLIPFIFHSDTAGILGYFELDFNNDGFLENSQTYNPTTYESSIEDFEINLSYDSSEWLDISATLYYNETGYSGDETGSGDHLVFDTSIITPPVDSDTNITFYWTITLTNATGIYYYNSSFYNITILTLPDIVITDGACAAGMFASINYTFAGERNLTALNANIKYNFKFGIGNLTANVVSGTFTDISSFRICINQTIDSYKLGYGEIEYDLSGFVSRRYYMFEEQTLSNSTTNNITIYQLESGKATSFLFEIKNTFLNPYTNKLVGLLRWYPQNDEYKVVELSKTDEDGKALMKVEVEDVDYRIGVWDLDGTLIKLAEPIRMACLIEPCTYSLTIITEEEVYFDIYGIESSLTFDEDNNRFVYIWNDPSQLTTSMRLIVVKESGFQEVVICNETGLGYTGVLTCDVGTYTGLLTARAFRTASPETILAVFSKTIGDFFNNTFGLFAAWMFILVAGLAGVWSPIAAIILSIPGLILAVIFGTINFTIFMGIVVLAGIIIHMIKKTK